MPNSFVDSIPAIMNAYRDAEMVIGEMIIDSSIQLAMMEACILRGGSLTELLPDSLYATVESWFQREAGMDLRGLDQLNPIAVTTIALGVVQQKYFPIPDGEAMMDIYFQQRARAEGKKLSGLETIEVQINALFKQINLERQVEVLSETFYGKMDMKTGITEMNKSYCAQDLTALEEMMYGTTYKPEEMKVFLDDRNNAWVEKLPGLMKEHPCFVAVGALHLAGANGLVNLLRGSGFELTPIKL
jgi:uncharacterized protein